MNNKYAVLILTHGRANNVKTVETLRRCGYTKDIYIVIDDTDKQTNEYKKRYGDKVVIFNKKEYAEKTDTADNFGNMKLVVYARNAAFDIAKNLGLDRFIVLDDDYSSFSYRTDDEAIYTKAESIKNLDFVFDSMFKFMESDERITSIAFSQGGDNMGAKKGTPIKNIGRKLMNSFFCFTNRPFNFFGSINEDTNCYVNLGSKGVLFFTIYQISLNQIATQQNSGGLTDAYLDAGTYIKSFYSVMYNPSSVKVSIMGQSAKRLHHLINWCNTVPKIIRESNKK